MRLSTLEVKRVQVNAPSALTTLKLPSQEAVRIRMLVFWHQGGLHIEPEGEQERRALVALVENAKFGKQAGTPIPGGSSESGGDELFDAVVGDHQFGPRSLSGKPNHNEPVVIVEKTT
jgi:hypothetical protein